MIQFENVSVRILMDLEEPQEEESLEFNLMMKLLKKYLQE